MMKAVIREYRYRLIFFAILLAIVIPLQLMMSDRKSGEIAAPGRQTPDFELRDTQDRLWKLSDHRGKVVFLNFWATWCAVCRSEMASKENLKAMMKDRSFLMLGILFRDDPDNAVPYIREQNISVPTLIDPGDRFAALYGIKGVPVTVIIDKDGIIREKIVGPRQWDSHDNVELIESWL